ncbi:response regulator [Uliginosibacterium flavum]|uniref:HD domain-containing phosphohydrolase n=1 Tax=Uliginosibacterium flavum TaxID=1396831 RepID=A0ABV2TIW3_9RHOO
MLAPLKGKILVVDDDETVRRVVSCMLEARGHTVTVVANGQEALTVARLGWAQVILTDIVMPVMDGFELVGRLKSDAATAHIPVIVMTSMDDRAARLRALEAGAEDFVLKPVDETELVTRVGNYLRLGDYFARVEDANRVLEREVRQQTDALRGANLETIFSLCRAMEYKDANTGAHLHRISQYSRVLADACGMDGSFVECLTHATPMHDIGKIGVPDAILLKPGPLDEAEWFVMRSHCAMGAHLLAGATSAYLVMGAEVALCHHENWDGSGYPQNLRGEAIPLAARIMAVCDRYDAVRSERPYKRAYSHAEAMEVMLKGDERSSPKHIDPDLLAVFARNSLRFDEVFRIHQTL